MSHLYVTDTLKHFYPLPTLTRWNPKRDQTKFYYTGITEESDSFHQWIKHKVNEWSWLVEENLNVTFFSGII